MELVINVFPWISSIQGGRSSPQKINGGRQSNGGLSPLLKGCAVHLIFNWQKQGPSQRHAMSRRSQVIKQGQAGGFSWRSVRRPGCFRVLGRTRVVRRAASPLSCALSLGFPPRPQPAPLGRFGEESRYSLNLSPSRASLFRLFRFRELAGRGFSSSEPQN